MDLRDEQEAISVAEEWLRLNAWEDRERIEKMPPSMTQKGIVHVEALLEVVRDLRRRQIDEGCRLREP